MSREAPVSVLHDTIADHAAARAWRTLHPAHPEPEMLEVWRENLKPAPASIYRLIFSTGTPRVVYAKRSPDLSVERTMYESVLPKLPIKSPIYYGFLEDPEGMCWIFLEDVGSERLSPRDPTHRALAARWVAQLHLHGARIEAASCLPAAGAERYLGHLRASRERIGRSLDHPAMSPEQREALAAVVALQDHLESRWDGIVRRCRQLPVTVVHGDLRPKNLRVRAEPPGVTLYGLDWETAGWGVAAPDLAPVGGRDLTMQIDTEVYRSAVCTAWPQLDAVSLRGLSLLGHIFRSLAGMDWESLDLDSGVPEYFSRPVASLRVIADSVSRGLGSDAAEWLT